MKILFIYPNLYAQIGFNYGIASLSAVLKEHGHLTSLININEKLGYPLDLSRIKKEVEDFAPDLIGFSLLTNQYQHALTIARSIKEYCSVPIIAGGVHATMAPVETLRSDCFDFVCRGEGEEALLELMSSLEKGKDTSGIPNIWAKKNGKIIQNRVRPLTDLDRLPFKDYQMFDFQKMIDAKNGWVGVMASRGCPFRCTYCFNHQMVDLYRKDLNLLPAQLNYIRRHPVEEVIHELEYLTNEYNNIEMFIFDDDLFTWDKKYLIDFCRHYKKKFTTPFVVNAHVKIFDEEIAENLKEAGCSMVKFGLESGSERIRRDILNRPMKDDQIADAFRIAHKHHLETSAFVMLGLPHETKEDIMMTIKLLAGIEPSRFRWSIFFPYPGTKAYQISEEGGFIDYDKMESLNNFTEESCLNFGKQHNLFLKKLKKSFPWWVNAHTKFSVSALYQELVRVIEEMDEKIWDHNEPKIIPLDNKISEFLQLTEKSHYAIKYNEFMAVKMGKS